MKRPKVVTDIRLVEKALKEPAIKWAGRCHEIANRIRSVGKLVPANSRLCYGVWHGPIESGSVFEGRSITHHGWLELPDQRIYDPTRWVFEGKEPYIFCGEDKQDYYDDAGQRLRSALLIDKSCPPGEGRDLSGLPRSSVEIFTTFLPVQATHINQIHWLANQPLSYFQGHAKLVLGEMVKNKLGGFIPVDIRDILDI